MAFQYLVVTSGTGQYLTENQLNAYGAANWELIHVGQGERSLKITYIFKK